MLVLTKSGGMQYAPATMRLINGMKCMLALKSCWQALLLHVSVSAISLELLGQIALDSQNQRLTVEDL